jgi:hypothetical protein
VINIVQPVCVAELKTKVIMFKVLHTNKQKGIDVAMHDLTAHLCGRHSSELQNHYSHVFGRRNDKGNPFQHTNVAMDPMREYSR